MMIDHVWSVFCTRAVIDRETNNISLLEVIEQLTIHETPPAEGNEAVVPGSFELVTLWTRRRDDEPVRGRCRVRFFRPSGVFDAFTQEYPIDLNTSRRLRHRAKFAGLPLREPGRHYFEVSLWDEEGEDWRMEAVVPLQVGFAPARPE